MRKLQEIIRVIARKRLRKIEVFNENGDDSRDNLYYKLYRGIRDGKFKSDEEASETLFGLPPSDKRYLMLKSRVKNRLMNSLFFLKVSSSRYQQAIYDSNREMYAAKILLLDGAKESGVGLLKSALHQARKFNLTDVAIECLRYLMLISSADGEISEYKKYRQMFKEFRLLQEDEIFSEECLNEINLQFGKSNSAKPELVGKVRSMVKEVENRANIRISHALKLNSIRLRLIMFHLEGNFRAMIGVAQEGENYLLRRPHLIQKARLAEFAMQQMVACLHLGDYETGESHAQKGIHYLNEGSQNWMIFLEYYFLLFMHTGKYEKAWDVYERVMASPRFDSLEEARAEKWKIFYAFLQYVSFRPDYEAQGKKFNIYKFLNEVPIFSRDKRGLNISILVLQILHLLDRKDWSGVISRTEALKVYISRHLKKDDTYRSNLFLKMVMLLEKRDFDGEESNVLARKYLTKLATARFDYQGSSANVEIIPYEQLWQKVIGKLSA